MKKYPHTLLSIVAAVFCLYINSCEKKATGKIPNLEPVKEWADSFLGKKKEYIYDYFGKGNVEKSTWLFEGNDELLLITKMDGMEFWFYFSDEVVVLSSIEYSGE